MFNSKRFVFASLFAVLTVGFSSTTQAKQCYSYPVPKMFRNTNTVIARNGFSPKVFASGAERDYIKSMNILDRPYRPFHFYGNVVRRQHFRKARR